MPCFPVTGVTIGNLRFATGNFTIDRRAVALSPATGPSLVVPHADIDRRQFDNAKSGCHMALTLSISPNLLAWAQDVGADVAAGCVLECVAPFAAVNRVRATLVEGRAHSEEVSPTPPDPIRRRTAVAAAPPVFPVANIAVSHFKFPVGTLTVGRDGITLDIAGAAEVLCIHYQSVRQQRFAPVASGKRRAELSVVDPTLAAWAKRTGVGCLNFFEGYDDPRVPYVVACEMSLAAAAALKRSLRAPA